MSFSNFIAAFKSPLILSFPDIKAVVALAFPANMSRNNLLSKAMLQSAFSSGPCPNEPVPFFKSRNQVPLLSPTKDRGK